MGGSVFAMFHLDYLSCLFTILATILLANVTAWLYSREPVLHRRIRVQHAAVVQGTHTHRDQARNRWSYLYEICALQKGLLLSSPIQSIISPELNICNKDRASGGTPCALT
jgi:hypothetical protein